MTEVIEQHEQGSARRVAHINYALLALGLFTGWLAAFAAMLLAYVKRDDAAGWLATHYAYQLRTFWWGLAWTALGWLLFVLIIGMLGPSWIIWGFAWLWGCYRVIKGWLRLVDQRPM
jgi:uncharacterized membrane protein